MAVLGCVIMLMFTGAVTKGKAQINNAALEAPAKSAAPGKAKR